MFAKIVLMIGVMGSVVAGAAAVFSLRQQHTDASPAQVPDELLPSSTEHAPSAGMLPAVDTGGEEKEARLESAPPTIVSAEAGPARGPRITDRFVSFGFEERQAHRYTDTLVLHTSYNNQGGDRYDPEKVIALWKHYKVAPHYLIDRAGNIFRLVSENNVAYHAGASKMPDGRAGVNEFSLGVEILNAKNDQLTSAQYDAVNILIAYVQATYEVRQVVGHADIASGRKTDPWNLDWKKLK